MGSEHLDQYVAQVYRFAAYALRDHHAAQDITQETMLRAWKRRRDLRRLRDPRAWLLRVAANLCKDHFRAQRNVARNAGPLVGDPDSGLPEPWFGMLQHENCQRIDEVIQSLTQRERSVLYLSAFEDLSNPEIADVLELNVGAVKVALSRARKTVRHAILQQRKHENHP